MQDKAVSITYRTMRRKLGKVLTDVEEMLGYDTGRGKRGLRMKNDFAVSFYKSTYQGKPCLYFVWSHIEHIFLED
jgi:hypothetical protein